MNNKNVYSLNNTFEGKIWVDWKGKDGKMGQEISWREKPNVNGTGTRVHSCKRLRPCAVSQISGCGRPQIIHTSMKMAAFSGMSTRVCVFEGIVYVDWKHRIGSDIGRCSKKNIGHRIGMQNWHRLILSSRLQDVSSRLHDAHSRCTVCWKHHDVRSRCAFTMCVYDVHLRCAFKMCIQHVHSRCAFKASRCGFTHVSCWYWLPPVLSVNSQAWYSSDLSRISDLFAVRNKITHSDLKSVWLFIDGFLKSIIIIATIVQVSL